MWEDKEAHNNKMQIIIMQIIIINSKVKCKIHLCLILLCLIIHFYSQVNKFYNFNIYFSIMVCKYYKFYTK